MKRHKAVLEYLGMYVYSCNSLVYAVDLVSDTVDLGIKKYDQLSILKFTKYGMYCTVQSLYMDFHIYKP